MSQTPADRSGQPTRGESRSSAPVDRQSLLERAVRRVRSGLDRWLARARGWFQSSERPDERAADRSQARPDATNADSLIVPTGERSLDTPRSYERPPGRAQLFTRPARADSGPNPPEPVARIDGDELTVELPGNPGTRITSDVWERVEP